MPRDVFDNCGPPHYPSYRECGYPSEPLRLHTPLPSVAEQMGTDPISKLAAAIDRLAAALEGQKQ